MMLSSMILFAADDIPVWGKELVIGFAVVLFGSMLVGLVFLIRDSVRRRGKWGMNGAPTFCPNCGEAAPTVRKPANFQQALWGGCTCKECGCEFDKWGRRVLCPQCEAKLPEVARPRAGSEKDVVRSACPSCKHESILFRLSPPLYDDECD
jgi:hypothetical protein